MVPSQPQISPTKNQSSRSTSWQLCHNTLEISYNDHCSVPITNPTCTFRDMSSTSSGEPNNYYQINDRRALQLDHLIDNSPHSNQHQQVHNTSIALNKKETACIEQLKPIVNEASHLASVMVGCLSSRQ